MIKVYPGKILLFGEYTVIGGGMALAVPSPIHQGHWHEVTDNRYSFEELLAYIKTELLDILDVIKLEDDIKTGLSFATNIPLGYGCGSSGAFTAALYDRYVTNKDASIIHTKSILAKIESFFHLKSSGIDPMVSYYNCPVWIESLDKIHLKSIISLKNWYLIDSGQSRSTSALVNKYKELLFKEDFRLANGQLQSLNEECIRAIISDDTIKLANLMKKVSVIQRDNYKFAILPHIDEIWKKGIDSGDYFMKLCGAGGGGFYLMYSTTKPEIDCISLN